MQKLVFIPSFSNKQSFLTIYRGTVIKNVKGIAKWRSMALSPKVLNGLEGTLRINWASNPNMPPPFGPQVYQHSKMGVECYGHVPQVSRHALPSLGLPVLVLNRGSSYMQLYIKRCDNLMFISKFKLCI